MTNVNKNLPADQTPTDDNVSAHYDPSATERALTEGFETGGSALPQQPVDDFEEEHYPRGEVIFGLASVQAQAKALVHDSGSEQIEPVLRACAELHPIDQSKILSLISKQVSLPRPDLRDELRRLTASRCDELAQALTVVDDLGEENVLSTKGVVYQWHSRGVWRVMDPQALKALIQRSLRSNELPVKNREVENIVAVFKTQVNRRDHVFDLGEDSVVNTRTGHVYVSPEGVSVRNHCREEYRLVQCPVEYDAQAKAPRFEKFLKEIFPEQDGADKSRAILEMFGYTLTRRTRQERFMLLIGKGGNGKSVLLRVLEGLCGRENTAAVQPHKFQNSFQRAHLEGKLANIVTEMSANTQLADGPLKAMTSGETATVEHKNRDPFDLRTYATCWLAANHMPKTADVSAGIARRALIIVFEQTFEADSALCNPDLVDELLDELPGILNLALEHYAQALRSNLTVPKSSREALSRWMAEANPVSQFVATNCEQDSQGSEKVSDLYTSFESWTRDQRLTTLSINCFSNALVALGCTRDRSQGHRVIRGLQLCSGKETPGRGGYAGLDG